MFRNLALAAAVLAFAAPASATVLVADTGWQDDTLNVAGEPTENSVWEFTVDALSILSVADAFVVGDVYVLSGDFDVATTFFAGEASDVQADGTTFGLTWLDAEYSKLAILVAPGSYSFSITGEGEGGLPAGLGVRLDTVQSVIPEPATWGLMILGFGLVGFASRRRATARPA
jgi:hypothetical protein